MRRPLIHYWRSCSPAPTRRKRRSSCSRSDWLLPTTYLLQVSSEKLAIYCANNGGTQLLRKVQDRFFSCLLFCRQTPFSAKQENPLSKASCGRRRRKKQQHLLGTTTHVATPEWIWVLLTEERILSQICWSLLSLNPTYPQQHRLLLLLQQKNHHTHEHNWPLDDETETNKKERKKEKRA